MCSIDVIQLFAFNSIKLKLNASINALTAIFECICWHSTSTAIHFVGIPIFNLTPFIRVLACMVCACMNVIQLETRVQSFKPHKKNTIDPVFLANIVNPEQLNSIDNLEIALVPNIGVPVCVARHPLAPTHFQLAYKTTLY